MSLGYAYLSKENSVSTGFRAFVIIWIYGAIFQLWPVISRNSKNVLFDGVLYDCVLFVSYILACIILGYTHKMTGIQYLGLATIVVGFVLMKAK